MSASAAPATVSESELDTMVAQDPRRPGRHNARLLGHGNTVRPLIAALRVEDWDVAAVARSYGRPEIAVRAAIHDDEHHRALIDADLLLSEEEWNG